MNNKRSLKIICYLNYSKGFRVDVDCIFKGVYNNSLLTPSKNKLGFVQRKLLFGRQKVSFYFKNEYDFELFTKEVSDHVRLDDSISFENKLIIN